MTIEVMGVEVVNKGAHLMLLAVLEQIRSRFPSARIAVTPRRGRLEYSDYSPLRMYGKVRNKRLELSWGPFRDSVSPTRRDMYGLVGEKDINVLLDASGFALGDQWGASKAEKRADEFERMKRNGTRIILLPQAFGPFTSQRIRRAVKRIVKASDLVFARERESFAHLADTAGSNDKISVAPDFTCLLSLHEPQTYVEATEKRLCIIPNEQNVKRAAQEEGKAYKRFLAWLSEYAVDSGLVPVYLIHEGVGDRRLADMAILDSGVEAQVVEYEDPMTLKRFIGESYVLVTGRYHGLVSGLCQGVPSLATSWSHKYELLLQDYGVQDGLLNPADDPIEWRRALDFNSDPENNSLIRHGLLNHAAIHATAATKMWAEVLDFMESHRLSRSGNRR